MKKLIPCLLLLVSTKAYTQEFTGQQTGYVHFYQRAASNSIDLVRCDSAGVSGSDSLYWYRPGLRSTTTDTSSTCTFWVGNSCMFMRDAPSLMGLQATASDRFIEYYNHLGDSIDFDLDGSVGDTSVVFEDSTQRIKILLLSAAPATSFGTSDSLLSFVFIHTDTLDNVLSTPLNGSAISFSKLYGMMNGYAMDSFPYVLKPVTLLGVRGPDVGFHGMSYASAFDFQVGDSYETHTYSMAPPPNNNYYRYTILTRNNFSDHVQYSVQRESQVLSYTSPPPYPYVYTTDTISVSHSTITWVDDSPVMGSWGLITYGGYFMDSVLLDCNVSLYSYFAHVDQCYAECPGTPCIGGADCFMLSKYDVKYTAGAGKINQFSQAITDPTSNFSEVLDYVNANGIECGHSTLGIKPVLENGALKIYPNPASTQAMIETTIPGLSIHSVRITDITGQNISARITANGTRVTVNLEGMGTGTYWAIVSTSHGTTTKQLVVMP